MIKSGQILATLRIVLEASSACGVGIAGLDCFQCHTDCARFRTAGTEEIKRERTTINWPPAVGATPVRVHAVCFGSPHLNINWRMSIQGVLLSRHAWQDLLAASIFAWRVCL